MTKWYIKEFSQLTGVSVRTLHHYDRINLLTPSIRLPNAYRLYNEADLLKLQNILALKFFRFTLPQIKKILEQPVDLKQHLLVQKTILEQEVKQLTTLDQLLGDVLGKLNSNRSVIFNEIVKLIEGYKMTETMKKTWAGKVYSEDMLKQFAEIKQTYSEKQMTDYANRWEQLIQEIKPHLSESPASPEGQRLARKWLDLLNEVYGQHPELKSAIGKAYEMNQIPEPPFDQRLFSWMNEAVKFLEENK